MNMLRTSLLALLFIALVAPSLSLKCYICASSGANCNTGKEVEQDCGPIAKAGTPTCMKTVGKDNTGKGCMTKKQCQFMVNLNSDAAMTYCCDTDLCNGTPAPLAGLGLLLVPALAYLAA